MEKKTTNIAAMNLRQLSAFVEKRGAKITDDEATEVAVRRAELANRPPSEGKKVKVAKVKSAAKSTTLAEIAATMPTELEALGESLPAEIAAATVELPEAVLAPVEVPVTTAVQVAAPVATAATVEAPRTAKVSVTAQPILKNGVHAAAYHKVRDMRLDEVLMFAEDVSNRGNICEKEIAIGEVFNHHGDLQFALWAARACSFRPLLVEGRPVRYRRNTVSVPTETVGYWLAQEENHRARANGVKADDLPYRPFAEFILRDCEQTDASIREYQVAEVKRRAKELGVALAG